jgi:GAF domain-containing protein/HAMP domain-containing protein
MEVVLGSASIHQLGQQALSVVAERPAAEALEPAYNTLYTLVITIIIALIIAASLGIWVVRQIVRPIEALSTTAQAISDGDLTQQVTVTSRDEFGKLAAAFNSMTAQLRNLIDNLEDRVEERTRALQTSAEISRQLGGILDFNQLLQTIVNLIKTEFHFDHTHIYLFDKVAGSLIMTEGSGNVGQQLKTEGYTLQLGQGIVGDVARRGEGVFISNVDNALNFAPNPFLPQTRSELAVPLRRGGEILGVLDIQSEELDAFTQADLTLMQSIADQVSIAVDNARLFREAQETLAEVETLNRHLIREAWYDISDKIDTTGFTFTKSGLAPASTDWIPAMTEAIQQKHLVHQSGGPNISDTTGTENTLAVPLTLRGEVIGVIGIERSSNKSWSHDELITIQTITEQVALALDAARLSRTTKRAAWRDQVISESTAKVWSSAEIEDVMRAAVAQLGDKLRASEVVIRLGTEAELALE